MLPAVILVALLGPTAVLAQEYLSTFGAVPVQSDRMQIQLGTVRAAADGVVEIYDFNNEVMGALLGSSPVSSGANSNYSVRLTTPVPATSSQAIAVMKINGEVVATEVLDPRR
jgi:uncharacterized membrane protein